MQGLAKLTQALELIKQLHVTLVADAMGKQSLPTEAQEEAAAAKIIGGLIAKAAVDLKEQLEALPAKLADVMQSTAMLPKPSKNSRTHDSSDAGGASCF